MTGLLGCPKGLFVPLGCRIQIQLGQVETWQNWWNTQLKDNPTQYLTIVQFRFSPLPRAGRVLRERQRVQSLHPRGRPAGLRRQVRHAPDQVQLLDLLAAHQGRRSRLPFNSLKFQIPLRKTSHLLILVRWAMF